MVATLMSSLRETGNGVYRSGVSDLFFESHLSQREFFWLLGWRLYEKINAASAYLA